MIGVENKLANYSYIVLIFYSYIYCCLGLDPILTSMAVQVVSFDSLKHDYSNYKDFNVIYEDLMVGQHANCSSYALPGSYRFKGTQHYLPNTTIREQVIWELHSGGAVGHFGQDK